MSGTWRITDHFEAMPNTRRTFPVRKVQTYKKRIQHFAVTAANTTPTSISQLVFRETGTVMSMKLNLGVLSVGATDNEIQELRIAVFVNRDPAGFAIPDIAQQEILERLNGFWIGNVWGGALNSAATRSRDTLPGSIMEKFNYRRRVKEGDAMELICDSIVRNGSARSMLVFGTVEYILLVT